MTARLCGTVPTILIVEPSDIDQVREMKSGPEKSAALVSKRTTLLLDVSTSKVFCRTKASRISFAAALKGSYAACGDGNDCGTLAVDSTTGLYDALIIAVG